MDLAILANLVSFRIMNRRVPGHAILISGYSRTGREAVLYHSPIGTLIKGVGEYEVRWPVVLFETAKEGELDLLITSDIVADIDEPGHLGYVSFLG